MNIKLVDIKPESNFFGLLVGDSGSGKTCAAASFPKPLIVLDIDKRASGINGASFIDKNEIYVERFKGDDILTELENLFNIWETERNFKYKTVVLDGFTSLAMLLIDSSFSLTSKMSGSRKTQGHPKVGSVDLPGWDEFAYEIQGFKNVMTYLKYGVKANIVCTAHWIDTYDETGKVNGKRINLRPRVVPIVSMFFDDIYYFEKRMQGEVINKVPVRTEKHSVEFRNEIARTTIASLPNLLDITSKLFYPELQKAMQATLEVTQLEGVK